MLAQTDFLSPLTILCYKTLKVRAQFSSFLTSVIAVFLKRGHISGMISIILYVNLIMIHCYNKALYCVYTCFISSHQWLRRKRARKRGQLGQITDVTCHNAKWKDKLREKNEYERTFEDKIRKKTTHSTWYKNEIPEGYFGHFLWHMNGSNCKSCPSWIPQRTHNQNTSGVESVGKGSPSGANSIMPSLVNGYQSNPLLSGLMSRGSENLLPQVTICLLHSQYILYCLSIQP